MSLKRWNGTAWVTVAGSRPGPTGPQGPAGTAATISVGSVNTIAAGSPATVTNSGTSSAAIFNFNIPAGTVGPAGTPGAAGPQGTPGQRGSYTYTGIANPTAQNPAQKNALDTYLNTTSGDYFQYSSSTTSWELVGNLRGPQGLSGATGPQGPVGPSGNELANDILAETTVARLDAMLNLGIYYPKYTSTLTQTQLNSKFAASSFLF